MLSQKNLECYIAGQESGIDTQIIFSTSLGFIFLGQVPDVLSFVGYLIIIGAAIWSWFINNHSEPQGSSHTAR